MASALDFIKSRSLSHARASHARACIAFLLVAFLAGCGSGSSTPTGRSASHVAPGTVSTSAGTVRLPTPLQHRTKATLILDFTPNAVHAGIYRAIAEGWYAKENIALQVIQPTVTSDTLELIDSGKASFGLADGSDVATEIASGGDAVAVMAIAQRPLGGLIARASEHLSSPAGLQGKRVGITGVPSDTAVLDTEVRHAGGDPAKVHIITVGFEGAQALRAGKIAAFTGFWPADGVGLQVSGEPITSFKLDENGGPGYPGLVMFTTRHMTASNPKLISDFVAATVRGYEQTLRTPEKSLKDLLRLNPELTAKLQRASLQAYLPLFSSPGVPLGTLRPEAIESLSSWMVSNGLIHAPVPFSRYGTDRFLPSGAAR